MRWRYGDTNPVIADVLAETVIEIGDLVWQDDGDVKPAALATDPEDFGASFLGVAMQRSRHGENHSIRVATTGVFEFDCAPADCFELGDVIVAEMFMEPSTRTVGLRSQEVAKAILEDPALASPEIGLAAKRHALPTKSVLVDIRSTVMKR